MPASHAELVQLSILESGFESLNITFEAMPVANKATDRRIRSESSGDAATAVSRTSSPRLTSTPPRPIGSGSSCPNPRKRRNDGGNRNLNVPSPGGACAAAAAAAWTNSLYVPGAPQISIPDPRLHAAASRPGSRYSSVRTLSHYNSK